MLRVTALDEDKGINDNIIYTIEGSCKECHTLLFMGINKVICFVPVSKLPQLKACSKSHRMTASYLCHRELTERLLVTK